MLRSKGQPAVPIDQDWVNQVQRENKSLADSLENALKAAKANLSKEDIRMCHIRLGDYFYNKGDLPSAMKNYVRTRDYCMTSQNVLDMCFHTIKVSYPPPRQCTHTQHADGDFSAAKRSTWTTATTPTSFKHTSLEQNPRPIYLIKSTP